MRSRINLICVVAHFLILTLADIHGNVKAVQKLLKTIKKIRNKIDLIIIAGDLPKTTPIKLMIQYMITHPFSAFSKRSYTHYVYKGNGRRKFVQHQIESAKLVINLLKKLNIPIIYTPGNVDSHEVQEFMRNIPDIDFKVLDCIIKKYKSLEIIACGGSEFNHKNYDVPLCDMEFSRHDFYLRTKGLFASNLNLEKDSCRILITHEPPVFYYNSQQGLIKGGSKAISKLIERLKPNLCIYGHYHEYSLNIRQGNTVYINPGPLACYYYSLINIEDGEINVKIKKMKSELFDTTNIIYQGRMLPNYNKQDFRFE